MISTSKQRNTLQGLELARELANRRLYIFTLQDAQDASSVVSIRKEYILEALYHLKQMGWITGIKRGMYVFTPDSGIASSPSDYEIAQSLVPGSALSYWTALRFYAMTQQLPRAIFSITPSGTTLPRSPSLNRFHYVRVKAEFIFGIDSVWIDGVKTYITDRERTLLEGLRHPELCGGFAEVLGAFESSIQESNLKKLIEYSLKLESVVSKRLGWILESLGYGIGVLQPLQDRIVKGPLKLDPRNPLKGDYIKKWQLQDNR